MIILLYKWMDGRMETVPGTKAFFSVRTVIAIGNQAHHMLHTVMLLEPKRGACKKNITVTGVQ